MTESAGKKFEDVSEVIRYQMDRRALFGAGAALAVGGLLSACSSGDNKGKSYTDNKPKKPAENQQIEIGKANIPTPREETVIIGQTEFTVFNSFNGRIPNGVSGAGGFDQFCKEFMFYLNLATGELMPWLCTEYKYNADFTELTFKFNPKAKWNDGQPLTSADFKFTQLMMRDNAVLLGSGGDAKDYIADVLTPDAQTAVLKLKKPNPRFHYGYICTIVGGFDIVPEHIWKGQDPTKFKDNPPVRTGPYKMKQAIESQKMFVWEKYDGYWNTEQLDPAVKYIVVQSTSKQADSAALAFERAEFDVGSIDEQHAKLLRSKSYPNLITTPFHDPCPRGLWLNSDPSRGVISENKMHWVISYLTDRAKIGKTVWSVEAPPAQYPWADYPQNKKYELENIASKYKLEYSPAKAEKLLDEIAPKGGDGKRMYKGKPATIEMITPSPPDGAEYIIIKLIKDELVKLGVEATAKSLSGPVYDERNQRGTYDVRSEWICSVSWDPQQLYGGLRSKFATPIGKNAVGKNQTRYRNAQMDTIADKLTNLDPESPEAKPLLEQGLELYFQTLPTVPVIQTNYPSYFNTTFWTGWPTEQDTYQVPNNWWGQFLFVIAKLKSTGTKAPK